MQLLFPILMIGALILVNVFTFKKAPPSTHAPSPTITVPPTITISPSLQTPTPTQKIAGNASSFLYPKAKIISQENATIHLESSDNPDVITDWYKNAIKEKGMSVTSFVVTKTNDNVHNVLAGANKVQNVKVTIIKSANDTKVNITVENP